MVSESNGVSCVYYNLTETVFFLSKTLSLILFSTGETLKKVVKTNSLQLQVHPRDPIQIPNSFLRLFIVELAHLARVIGNLEENEFF